MIANRTDNGWDIIFQPAHALLSAQLAGRWRPEARPARWWETLVAVAQHDNGWREWEEAPRVTAGGEPVNFTQMSLDDAFAQWRRGIARGAHQGQWVGLLISAHATQLYEGRRGESPEIAAFLDQELERQEMWRRALGASRDEVAAAYRMVRWTDWLSLVLGWERLPLDGSRLSLGEGSDGRRYEAMSLEDRLVRIDPWPFEEERFTVSVEGRHLPFASFDSDAALLSALRAAPVHRSQWEMIR